MTDQIAAAHAGRAARYRTGMYARQEPGTHACGGSLSHGRSSPPGVVAERWPEHEQAADLVPYALMTVIPLPGNL
jgi:hypothetical protein